jgi:protein phosphatase
MGGHAEGATASQLITKSLPLILCEKLGKLKSTASKSIRKAIKKSVFELNNHVRNEGIKGTGDKNMGATLVMAMLTNDRVYISNVGDSRAYSLYKNRLRQLTIDHTVIAELLEEGHIKPEETENHPEQHIITQCVGIDADVAPFIRSIAIEKIDRLLLCSDGLTSVVPDNQIKKILKKHDEPELACKALIATANAGGGPDNITVIIVDIPYS